MGREEHGEEPPEKTADPVIAGGKRHPSSLVHITISKGASVT